MADARPLMDTQVARDFSYRARRVAGDGWVLVGDALGFIDPIYSTGVFLALKSGEMAADAILEGFASGDLSASRLGSFGENYLGAMDAMLEMVSAFYDPRFHFAGFLREHPECREEIIHLLMGHVFREGTNGLLTALNSYREAQAPETAPPS